jgi:uncharacterized protein involved in high-affinity Fe2+ transport
MRLATALLSASAFAAGPVMAANGFYIGEPVTRDGLKIVPGYLTGTEMDRTPAGMSSGPGSIHLQADVTATGEEAHGFPENAWIPYLAISFILTKEGAPTYKRNGLLYPIAAKDGPHYGADVDIAGPGTYRLTYLISPPTAHGLLRRTDTAGGVPAWWKPITVDWTFTYPGKSR